MQVAMEKVIDCKLTNQMLGGKGNDKWRIHQKEAN